MGRLRRLAHPFARYLLAGGLVALVYLGLTAALISATDLDVQVAVAIGYFSGIAVHFALQRGFVFSTQAGYALSVRGQAWRYAAVALSQYAFTALAVGVLTAGGVPDLPAALVTAAVLTPAVFHLLRTRLFHAPVDAAS